MAGDWIKMRGNLWDDPRVSSICDATSQPEAMVIGALYWLWATADQHTENGFLPGYSSSSIDRKTGVPGFSAALAAIDWLEEIPGGVEISRFEEHNGASAKRRVVEAQRKANGRRLSASDADTLRTSGGQAADKNRTPCGAREEKRREERNTTTPNGVGAVAPKTTDPEVIIFGYGVPYLVEHGSTDKAARSFLGGLRKGHGDAAVIDSLRRAMKERPLEPVSWLSAALPPPNHGARKPQALSDAGQQTMVNAAAAKERLFGPKEPP